MQTALAENSHLDIDACVAENSRLGFQAVFAGVYPALGEVKPNIASGIGDAVRREGIRSRCTGKERDPETGLDFFGARYLSAAQGRFTSPDEPLIDQYPGDPQSWNLYSYVRNNPLNAVDPTGQDCVYINDNTVGLERGNCSKTSGTYVNGTIDAKSFTYDQRKGTLGYSYTNDGALGTGVIAGVYPSRSEVSSDDLFNAVARGTQMAAPGVNLAAAGLQAFGYVVAPWSMMAAQCGAGACSKGDIAMATMVPLTGGALKILGGIAPLAGETVANAIRIRGGGGAQVNKVATWLAPKTVAEVAELAAKGNAEAKTAIKIIKDAARLSQK